MRVPWPHRGDVGAHALFVAAAVVLLWPALVGGQVLLPAQYLLAFEPWRSEHGLPAGAPTWDALLADSILQYLPWRHFAAETLRAGFLPLWNPHQFCGTPFIANYQSAVFYPPNLLFWVMPAARAFAFSALLHLVLGASFLYAYLRGLGLRRTAAALGALTFELCGFVVAWLELPTALNVVVWLPLALHRYERSRIRAGALSGLPVVLPLAMVLLAGHPQFALYVLLAFTIYALAHPPEGARLRDRTAGLLACLALPLAAAGALAALQVLPMLELSRMSHRSGGSLLVPDASGYRLQALPFWAGVVLLLPRFFGDRVRGGTWGPANPAEFAGYIGVAPLLLALAALLLLVVPPWRRQASAVVPDGVVRRAALLAAIAVAAVLASFRTPVGEAIHALVPGLGRFGSPGRMLCLFSVAGAAVAAVGCHALLHRGLACRARVVAAAAGLVAAWLGLHVTAAASGAAAMGAGASAEVLASASEAAGRFLGLLVLTSGVLGLAAVGRLSPGLTRGLLLGVTAADLLAAAWGQNPTAPAEMAYPPSPLLARVRAAGPATRVLALTPSWTLPGYPTTVLPPNGATACGLYDVNGYDSLYLLRYKEHLDRMGGRDSSPPANGNMVLFGGYGAQGFRSLACRYILSLRPLSSADMSLVADGPVKLYEFQEAWPRAFAAADIRSGPAPGGWAEVRVDAPTRLTVRVGRAAQPYLVILDTWYPGWGATVDGRPTAVERAHGVFRAVRVPPGARTVELRYSPATFGFGLFVSLVALAAIAAGCALSRLSPGGALPEGSRGLA